MGHIKRKRRKMDLGLMALEPRWMFDGAAAIDAAHAAPDPAAKALIPDAPAPVEVKAADPAQNSGKKGGVFVDTSVADYKTLEAAVKPGVEIEEIDGGQSGLAQMAKWAETHAGYDSISILSHGNDGMVKVGTDVLTEAALSDAATQAELAQIGHALQAGGDLLLYGCDIAADGDGKTFVNDLAVATGADVAASTDITGIHGNWTLEYQSGSVERDTSFDDRALSGYDHDLTAGYFEMGTGVSLVYAPNGSLYASINGSYSFYFNANTTTQSYHVEFNGSYQYTAGPNLGQTVFLVGTQDFVSSPAPTFTGFPPDASYPYKITITGGGATMKIGNNPQTATTDFVPTYAGTFNISSVVGLDFSWNSITTDVTRTGSRAINPNTSPSFVGGSSQLLTVAVGASAVDLKSYLHVSDSDTTSQTETWTQSSGPSHGSLSISGATGTSGSTDITPSGTVTYTPTAGYTGTDSFSIQVSDGTATATKTFNVTVNDAPTITGASAGQTVNDNATDMPFSGVTIADNGTSDGSTAQTQTVHVTLDTAAKGSFTTLNGFTNAGGGDYTFSGTAAAATTAIRGLVFTPTANRVAPGSTETTTFTISTNDGITTTRLYRHSACV